MPGLVLKFRFFFGQPLVPVRILIPPVSAAFAGPPTNADMMPPRSAFSGPPPLHPMMPVEEPDFVGASDI